MTPCRRSSSRFHEVLASRKIILGTGAFGTMDKSARLLLPLSLYHVVLSFVRSVIVLTVCRLSCAYLEHRKKGDPLIYGFYWSMDFFARLLVLQSRVQTRLIGRCIVY